MADWRLVITGCGTSHGNPPWGLPEMWSGARKDVRRRSGAALLGPLGEVVLIDCGPDLMHQLRDPFADWDGVSYPQSCLTRCDGLLLTHDHADHSHGLNDLRHLNRLMGGTGITIHGAARHLDELHRMFPYCFGDTEAFYRQGNPQLRTAPIGPREERSVAGLTVCPYVVDHGPAGLVYAWRLGAGVGYMTDAKTVPADTRAAFRNLDLLVINMLQEREHATHLNWAECQAVLDDLRPRRAVLTHMGYSVRWHDWQDRLPAGVEMAYDGWHTTFSAAAAGAQ